MATEKTANRRHFLLAFFLLGGGLVLARQVWSWQSSYRVVGIVDGDTFFVDRGGDWQLVQLAGADAPELHKEQAFALDAVHYLRDRILHRRVRLEFLDFARPLDDKGRWLCWAWISDENLSEELVGVGLARFSGAAESDRRERLLQLEARARREQRGMWSVDRR